MKFQYRIPMSTCTVYYGLYIFNGNSVSLVYLLSLLKVTCLTAVKHLADDSTTDGRPLTTSFCVVSQMYILPI